MSQDEGIGGDGSPETDENKNATAGGNETAGTDTDDEGKVSDEEAAALAEPEITSENVQDELDKYLGEIDSKISSEIFGVISQYMAWFPVMDKLDGFILIYGANQFLHGIVKVLKRNKVDGPRTREIARVWTVRLFQIDDKKWTPHWLMKPFEGE